MKVSQQPIAKRAVLYARVSTDQQSEKGYSIPSQLKACRNYAEQQGWVVVGEFADDCSGTIPVARRPEGARLYQLVSAGDTDAVVLYTIDRAARDEDVLEFLVFKRDMREAKVELHFCDSGKVADNPIAGVIDYFKAAQASDERKKIIERTNRGKREKAENGKFVGGMPTAYGYKWASKGSEAQLVIDETEAAIVRRIYRLYTEGENGQPPLRIKGIAVKLTAEGVPPPYGRGKSSGRGWWPFTVKQILTRRNYLGEFPNFLTTKVVRNLAIINPATWQLAQDRREQNKNYSLRNGKRNYLLSGVIKCTCGRSFCGSARSKRSGAGEYRWYSCVGQRVYRHLIECRELGLAAEDVEARVWDWLLKQLGEKIINEGLKARAKRDALEVTPKQQELAQIKKDIERVERQIKRLLLEFSKEEDETIAAESRVTIKVLAKDKEAMIAKRDRLTGELVGQILDPAKHIAIQKSAEKIRHKIAGGGHPTFSQKRDVIELLELQAKLGYKEKRRVLFVSYVLRAEPDIVPLDSDEGGGELKNARGYKVLSR